MERDPMSRGKTCRICWEGNQKKLLSLCGCKGSQRYVHEDCIKAWIKHKKHLSYKPLTQEGENNITCELCQEKITFFLESQKLPPFNILQVLRKSIKTIICLLSVLIFFEVVFIYFVCNLDKKVAGIVILSLLITAFFVCFLIFFGSVLKWENKTN
jgi:E3 ubiquitin-protein ligase DOA10